MQSDIPIMPNTPTIEPGYALYDMHCHLGFAADPLAIAREGRTLHLAFFSTSVTPQEYLEHKQQLQGEPNVALGVGLHPWWLEQEQAAPAEVCELIQETDYVGEIGMDCYEQRAFFEEEQREALKSIVHECVEAGGRVMSLHSVKAATPVLDVLEHADAFSTCTCIFHWFSGSEAELLRAINAGCYFSVGPRMLATRKGKNFVREIPEERLLLETDLPPQPNATTPRHERYDVAHHRQLLEETLMRIAQIREVPDYAMERFARTIAYTSAQILGF